MLYSGVRGGCPLFRMPVRTPPQGASFCQAQEGGVGKILRELATQALCKGDEPFYQKIIDEKINKQTDVDLYKFFKLH